MSETKTIKLSETTGMLRRIASAMVAEHGEYRAMVGGVPTLVLRDDPCAICEDALGRIDAEWDGEAVKVCRDCYKYETGEEPEADPLTSLDWDVTVHNGRTRVTFYREGGVELAVREPCGGIMHMQRLRDDGWYVPLDHDDAQRDAQRMLQALSERLSIERGGA